MTVAQQGMPRLTSAMVDSTGRLTTEWARLLIKMQQVTGGATAVTVMAYVAVVGSDVNLYDASTGQLLGVLENSSAPGAAPVPIALGGSPTVYTAAGAGFALVAGAQVELKRGASAWTLASPNGGSFAMRSGDAIRLTWVDPAVPPTASWWGN